MLSSQMLWPRSARARVVGMTSSGSACARCDGTPGEEGTSGVLRGDQAMDESAPQCGADRLDLALAGRQRDDVRDLPKLVAADRDAAIGDTRRTDLLTVRIEHHRAAVRDRAGGVEG